MVSETICSMPLIEWACVAAGMMFLCRLTDQHRDKLTCGYCGEYRGHDVHCPYKDI